MKDDGSSNSTWLEKRWVRSRILFYDSEPAGNQVEPNAVDGFILTEHEVESDSDRKRLQEWLPSNLGNSALSGTKVHCFTIEVVESRRCVGAASLLYAQTSGIWYDNVPMARGESRLVGFYVDPEFRGWRLGSWLQNHFFWKAVRSPEFTMVSAVVESHRLPSIRAQRSRFNTETRNVLIKMWGKNIFSAVQGGPHQGIWYVGPGRYRRLARES